MPLLRFPYREAGLSDEEAAAHLLGRFTFGPTPGEVSRVAAEGLEAWFERQLRAHAPDPEWDALSRSAPVVGLPATAVAARLSSARRVRQLALDAGAIDTLKPPKGDAQAWWERVRAFKQDEGLVTASEIAAAARRARIARAAVGANQLHEVMAAFWANHLYVGATPASRPFLSAYDHEVIRPHALGAFPDLLAASARHPAMLFYLDNAASSAPRGTPTAAPHLRGFGGRSRGFNENYARELLELHTLGADGPYAQSDVVDVARVLSGWAVLPQQHWHAGPSAWETLLEQTSPHRARYVLDGLFLFRADLHDATAKQVIGERVPDGGGIEEGEQLLGRLASHPATARHVCTKLARRFAADAPPEALVEPMAQAYAASGGDTKAVLRALAGAPAFWNEDVVRAKVRTPFEFVIAAARGTGAELDFRNDLAGHLDALGEQPFGHTAPDGYPDHASAWINAGTLLNRMRFGVDFATGQLRGVRIAPDRLVAAAGFNPADPADALEAWLDALLAGRDLDPTRDLLQPVLEQEAYAERIAAAAPPPTPASDDDLEDEDEMAPTNGTRRRRRTRGPSSPAEQALSVVLGSPEFQRQ